MSLIADMRYFYGAAVDESLMAAELRYLSGKGFSTGMVNQRWAEYLYSLGYEQAFPECQRLYFRAKTGKESYQEAMNAFYSPLMAGVAESVSATEGRTITLP